MNNNLEIYNIPHHSDTWYRFRTTGLTKQDCIDFNCKQYDGGIGGSEIGLFLGYRKTVDSPIYQFHRKVGTIEPYREDNSAMFWGRRLEEVVADMWQRWNGEKDGYIQNYENNKIIRKCRKLNGYIVNQKYPWLFGSIDRLINKKTGVNLITGQLLEKEAILECKNINIFAFNSYEKGPPDDHLAQVHLYMIIWEVEYAEIAILIGGNRFEVIPIEKNKELAEQIIEQSHHWWYNRILPAREAYIKMQGFIVKNEIRAVEEMQAIIDSLEPEPNSSKAYAEYMKEQNQKEIERMPGDIDDLEIGLKDLYIAEIVKRLESERATLQNKIYKKLKENNVSQLNFDSMGYMGLSKKNSWLNKINENIDDNIVQREFDKIKFNF